MSAQNKNSGAFALLPYVGFHFVSFNFWCCTLHWV